MLSRITGAKTLFKHFILILAVSVILILFASLHAAASGSTSWVKGGSLEVQSSVKSEKHFHPRMVKDCKKETIPTKYKDGGITKGEDVEACVVSGTYLSIAYTSTARTYVSYKSDTYFYRLGNYRNSFPLYLFSGSDRALYFYDYVGVYGGAVNIFDNISSRLTLDKSTLLYKLTDLTDRLYPKYDDDQSTLDDDVGTFLVYHSNNGKFLVFVKRGGYSHDDIYLRVNVETGEMKEFGRGWYTYEYSPLPNPELAISDDGKHVVGVGVDRLKAWHLTDDCLKESPNSIGRWPDACPNRIINIEDYGESMVDSPEWGPETSLPKFNHDASELSFTFSKGAESKRITIAAPGHVPSQSLSYLALGDSISSGEGDTEINPATGDKYYRSHTDVEEDKSQNRPREKCHLSTRSYPYALAKWMNLAMDSPKEWNSVACSGARTSDIYSGGYGFLYNGQNKGATGLFERNVPRLEGYSDRVDLQAKALNEMIPGRIEQIKFVEKYKPKVITLTVGANDIDFSGKLQSCLMSTWTCSWATHDRAIIGSQIKSEYHSLVDLYTDLYEASGRQAKIYVIGYPLLISDSEDAKCKNTLSINHEERILIAKATEYLNETIQAAANRAGVKYIDPYNALAGGRLCEDDQAYVTAISHRGKSEIQESFHPNADGHVKISESIQVEVDSKSLLSYDICPESESNRCPDGAGTAPDLPEYFGLEKRTKTIEAAPAVVGVGNRINLSIPKYTLEPRGIVNFILHSDSVSLGEGVALSDGSVEVEIEIPMDVPAGYHTLIMNGRTYSGEPIELTQSIVVYGVNPDDKDDNGISDSDQSCGLFMELSGEDVDKDGVDDVCDSEITEPSIDPPHDPKDGDDYQGETPEKPRSVVADLVRSVIDIFLKVKHLPILIVTTLVLFIRVLR